MTRKLLPSLLAASLPARLAPAGATAAPWTGARPAACCAKQRQVATFRFRTRVRFRVGNARLFRTFTLPQYVDVG
jgi:hypothetical protein